MPPNRKKNRSLVSNSDKIAHLTHNWKHRTSNQQNWSILHPAGRLHSHLDSLRSTTIQPCTRFAGSPEASYPSAFSMGFSSFSCILFYFLQCRPLLLCVAAAQSAAAADRAGSARWRGAARGNRPLRDQVCMRHFPFVSDGYTFSRTRLVFDRFITS